MSPSSRRGVLAAAGAVFSGSLAGCIGGVTSTSAEGDEGASGAEGAGGSERASGGQETTAQGKRMQGIPLAADTLPIEYDYEDLRSGVRSGGPPKDGIPSIDEPKFWSAEKADSELRDRDVVFGLVRNGEVKAYPQKILVHHEIANDELGGEPISVSYCPLTGTAMGFERGETTFGVSGKLLNNNLVMYDRATDSRWPQVLGTAISGEFEGESLREFRLVWTTWRRWKRAHPDTQVLSEDTGHVRNYGQDPYGSYVPNPSGYYSRDSTLFPELHEDDRLPNKTVVMGARTEEKRLAIEKDALREQKLISTTSDAGGDVDHLAVYDPDLDTGYVYRNPDGAEFSYDAENGEAVAPDGTAHEPANLPLDRVYAFDAMWFAWSGFYPSTEVVTE